jgi:hypothetical protein
MKTITDIIDEYRNRIAQSTNLSLDEASQIMVELSSLLGNINEEIREAERIYLNKFADMLNTPELSVARATILIKITPEYQRWDKAKGYEKFTLEMIRALKHRCRALHDEIEISNNI